MEPPVIRVLVIDDDEEEYILVAKYLRKGTTANYSVSWIAAYDQALATALDDSHDICLLDYQLGEHTGIELLRDLRAKGYRRPVVLLTGHGNVEIDMQAMELGALDHIEKAELTPKLLERSIRYAIENHRVREALQKANEELERRVQERTAELHRSNLELEQFAEVVARDLQLPLRKVVEHVDTATLSTRSGEPEETLKSLTETMDVVMLELRNLDLMVKLVLEYSLTRKEREPFGEVDLDEVVHSVCKGLKHRIDKLGASVDAGVLPTVKGDAQLLRGLFENLLDNALKYRSEKPPAVQVVANMKNDIWLCEVRDNGLGIAEEDSDEIFVMLARGGHAQKTQGVGIGLPLCRKIIEYHAGHIWVDTRHEGGSSFFFSLPAT